MKHLATINKCVLPETTDPDREIRYLDISAVGRGVAAAEPELMTFAAAPSRARRLVQDGDTIISTVRTYLRAVLPIKNPDPALVVSTGFAVLTPGPRLDPGYFAWVMQSDPFVEAVVARSVGVSYPAINASEIGDIKIRLAGLAEQRAIADYLDTETARIDALITKKQRMIELLDGRRVAALWDLLEKASPHPIRVKSLVTKVGSGSTPRGGADVYVGEGVAFLRSQNVRDGRVIPDDVVFITEDEDAAMSGTRVREGDVLLNITGGSIGRTAVVTAADLPANVSQHVCILRPAQGIEAKVLQAALETKSVREQISLMQVGGNREGLNFEQVRNLEVRVSLTGTAALVRGIDHVNAKHRRATSALGQQIDLLREHRQALITAAVTGELEVPGVAA